MIEKEHSHPCFFNQVYKIILINYLLTVNTRLIAIWYQNHVRLEMTLVYFVATVSKRS